MPAAALRGRCASASLGSRNGRLRWSSRHARSGRRHRAYGQSRDGGAPRTRTHPSGRCHDRLAVDREAFGLDPRRSGTNRRQLSPASHCLAAIEPRCGTIPDARSCGRRHARFRGPNPSAQIGPRPPQSLPLAARTMSSGTATVIVWAASPCQQYAAVTLRGRAGRRR
jgi:hypothetical protein